MTSTVEAITSGILTETEHGLVGRKSNSPWNSQLFKEVDIVEKYGYIWKYGKKYYTVRNYIRILKSSEFQLG